MSTAVQQIRQAYGPDQVILIDNGDLFQSTPVSEEHLLRGPHAGDEPEAMALCLTEIGYDVLVPGNHEFNYPWAKMRSVYDGLAENGVRVLAANAYFDGSDGVHGCFVKSAGARNDQVLEYFGGRINTCRFSPSDLTCSTSTKSLGEQTESGEARVCPGQTVGRRRSVYSDTSTIRPMRRRTDHDRQ